MRVHFVSLPHTETTDEYCFCAYTGKQLRIGGMVLDAGHEAVLYGGTRNTGRFTEHVEIVTDTDREAWFGHLDWDRDVFSDWDPASECWQAMNSRAIDEIRLRIRPGDAIGIIAGRCQQAVTDAFPDHLALEWACGYEGIMPARTHICFESQSHRAYVYGKAGIDNGRFYDTVIPNAFDPDDLIFRADKDDYLLYLGRMTERKGMAIVAELASRHQVITAGQGDLRIPGAEHVGVVRGKVKADLLAGATAVLCPTLYIEPFGGVAVEAMLSGTPVISTDFGAFTETVAPGVSGFRCNTLAEFVAAADRAGQLDPHVVARWAQDRFTVDVCSELYGQWLTRVDGLHRDGWYEA